VAWGSDEIKKEREGRDSPASHLGAHLHTRGGLNVPFNVCIMFMCLGECGG